MKEKWLDLIFSVFSLLFIMLESSAILWYTSRGRNDFINEFGFSALPELLDNHLQLFILLVDGT